MFFYFKEVFLRGLFLFIILSFSFYAFCDGFSVASYNVQNLFDSVEDGTEYPEFLPSSGWSEAYARKNMASVASVIRRLDADVVLLQEVENQRVLDVMRDEFLSDMGYIEAFSPDTSSATSVAVLSRFAFSYVRVHSFYNEDFPYLRPVVEFSFSYGGEDFVVFVVHLKSKRGGDKETEPARLFQLRLVASRIAELMADGVVNIIIGGDFNERDNAVEDFVDSFSGHDFVSVWDAFSLEGGSYFFDNRWERIDSFFFSPALFDRLGFDVVFAKNISEELVSKGRPLRRDYITGKGFSDHLPLLMRVGALTAE